MAATTPAARGYGALRRNVVAGRACLGITQAELARRLDVSEPTVRGWEAGRVTLPRVDVALRLARLLDTNVETLMEGTWDR